MTIRNDVVYISCEQFQNGGGDTLAYQFAINLGISVFVPETFFLKESPLFTVYRDDTIWDQLYKIKPKLVIMLSSFKSFGKQDEFVSKMLVRLRDEIGTKLVMVDCARRLLLPEKIITSPHCSYILNTFDRVWALNDVAPPIPEGSRIKSINKVDFNLYKYIEDLPAIQFQERTVGYASRFHNFKGHPRLFKVVEDYIGKGLLNSNMKWNFFGANFRKRDFEEKGVIAGNLIDINLLSYSVADKRPRECFHVIVDESRQTVPNRMNVFLRYDFNKKHEQVYPNIKLAICPSLARQFKEENEKDDSYIEKNKQYWTIALEYANMELINYGIPVLFSKDFCLVYDKSMLDRFPKLIYNNLEEAVDKIQEQYDDLIPEIKKQQEWLKEKVEQVRESLIDRIQCLLEEVNEK